jgi:solute carrier family 26 (sodium-independent sulfate anion transporter), member 11
VYSFTYGHHVAFGRVNGYKIDPNQELIAIGVTNTIGSLFSAYPATGSFTRSALSCKSGVRSPAGGLITGVIVIIALYGLTSAFYWIPSAALSAVIIHAVADLVTSPSKIYFYWSISPLECVIWAAAVLATIFSSIEDGIYTSVVASVILLLVRVAHPRGIFLGKVTLQCDWPNPEKTREVFVPMTQNGHSNLEIEPPCPGIVVYRFEESFLFPNASLANSALVDHIKANTRRGKDMSAVNPGDRPWNDTAPSVFGDDSEWLENAKKPELRAVVLDFSAMYVIFVFLVWQLD